MINLTKAKVFLNVIFASLLTSGAVFGQNPQPGYTKVLKHTTTTHSQGGTILDHNGIRSGGFSNVQPPQGEPITHIRDFYTFWPQNGTTLAASVTIDEIFQNGNSIGCNAYVTNFPYNPTSNAYYGFLPCSVIMNSPYNGFLTNNILHENSAGPDYNMTILDANLDLQVNSSKIIGTPWLENNAYCSDCPDQNLSPSRVDGYFLGATRMSVLGGPSRIAVTLLDDNHSVIWGREIDSKKPNYLQLTRLMGTNSGSVLLNYRNGWSAGGVIQLDANGDPEWAREYYLKGPGVAVKVPAQKSDMYQDPNDPTANIYYVFHAISDASVTLDVPFAVTEISALNGQPLTKFMFTYPGYRLLPAKIGKSLDGDFIVVGQIIQNGTSGLSDILVAKISPAGALTYAKSYHLGNYATATDFSITSSGGIWVSGSTNIEHPSDEDNRDYFLMKLGPVGAVINGHYYKTDAPEQSRSLLTPPTGDHLVEGFYRSSLTSYPGVNSFSRLFVKADPDGVALYCNSIPFDITGTNLPLTPGGETTSSVILGITSTPLNLTSADIITVEQPSGCEDCHCE